MFEFQTLPWRTTRLRVRRGLRATAALLCLAIAPSRGEAQVRSTDELRRMNESVDALIRKVSPSVVQILVSGYGQIEESDHGNTGVVIGRQRAIGSGFIIDPSGYIVTNAHVVNGAQRVQVVLPSATADGSLDSALSGRVNIVPARVVGTTREIDLALLKVDGAKLPATSCN